MNNNITNTIETITIDRLYTIEREREGTLMDKNYIQWCKDMKIGTRIEVKDFRAKEIMLQYTDLHKWIKQKCIKG